MLRCVSTSSKFTIQMDSMRTKSYISNSFKGAISENKEVLHCEGYDYEESADEIMEALLSETFSPKRMKMLPRPDGFMLYGKLSVEFFSTSELL